MTARLAGRTAIVTGVGRGVGRALVQRFGADGVRVVALDLDAAAAAKTIRAADNAAPHAALPTMPPPTRRSPAMSPTAHRLPPAVNPRAP